MTATAKKTKATTASSAPTFSIYVPPEDVETIRAAVEQIKKKTGKSLSNVFRQLVMNAEYDVIKGEVRTRAK